MLSRDLFSLIVQLSPATWRLLCVHKDYFECAMLWRAAGPLPLTMWSQFQHTIERLPALAAAIPRHLKWHFPSRKFTEVYRAGRYIIGAEATALCLRRIDLTTGASLTYEITSERYNAHPISIMGVSYDETQIVIFDPTRTQYTVIDVETMQRVGIIPKSACRAQFSFICRGIFYPTEHGAVGYPSGERIPVALNQCHLYETEGGYVMSSTCNSAGGPVFVDRAFFPQPVKPLGYMQCIVPYGAREFAMMFKGSLCRVTAEHEVIPPRGQVYRTYTAYYWFIHRIEARPPLVHVVERNQQGIDVHTVENIESGRVLYTGQAPCCLTPHGCCVYFEHRVYILPLL